MKKKSEGNRKVCGNCRYHNAYQYPGLVFCFWKFTERKKSAVPILFTCSDWEQQVQECNCLEDYLKKHKKNTK